MMKNQLSFDIEKSAILSIRWIFLAYFYDIFDRFDCFESIFDSDFSEIFIIFFILFKYFFDDYKTRMFVMKKMQIFISSFLVIIDFISSFQSSKTSSIVSIGVEYRFFLCWAASFLFFVFEFFDFFRCYL